MIIKQKYTLRPLQNEDAESLAKNANNINIWNNVRDYFPNPYTLQDAYNFIEYTRQKEQLENLTIAINGKAAGMVGFIPGSDVERLNAEIGYWLGEEHWGKGIMSAVVKDIIGYIFGNTPFIRLYAPVFEFNFASMKVLENNGFNKIAILTNAGIKNNKIIDLHYYELLKQI